jgi:hypothetical protein
MVISRSLVKLAKVTINCEVRSDVPSLLMCQFSSLGDGLTTVVHIVKLRNVIAIVAMTGSHHPDIHDNIEISLMNLAKVTINCVVRSDVPSLLI